MNRHRKMHFVLVALLATGCIVDSTQEDVGDPGDGILIRGTTTVWPSGSPLAGVKITLTHSTESCFDAEPTTIEGPTTIHDPGGWYCSPSIGIDATTYSDDQGYFGLKHAFEEGKTYTLYASAQGSKYMLHCPCIDDATCLTYMGGTSRCFPDPLVPPYGNTEIHFEFMDVALDPSLNHPPVIMSADAYPRIVVVGGTVTLSALTHDEDGDMLLYKWACVEPWSGVEVGTFLDGERKQVAHWLAPNEPGIYSCQITVQEVREGPDKEDAETVPIRVVAAG